MKIEIIFKWFDFWIGIFYDKNKNWIYLLPIPMIGVILKLPQNWRISHVVMMWKLPKYGTCVECKNKRATHDYNGHNIMYVSLAMIVLIVTLKRIINETTNTTSNKHSNKL